MENKRISSAPLIRKKYDIKELPNKLNDNNYLFFNEKEKIKLERNTKSAQISNNNKVKKLLYNNNQGRSYSGSVINDNNNSNNIGGVVERLRSASTRLPLQSISNQAIEISDQVLYGSGLKTKGIDIHDIKNRHKSPLYSLIRDKNDKEIEKDAMELISYLIGNNKNNNDIEINNDKNINLFFNKKNNNSNSNNKDKDGDENNINDKVEIINNKKVFSNINNKRINSAIKKPNSAPLISSSNKLASQLQEIETSFNIYNDDNDFVNEDDNEDDKVDGDVDNAISKYAKEGRVFRPLTSKIRDDKNVSLNDNFDMVKEYTKRASSVIKKPNSAPLNTTNNKLAPHLQQVKDYLHAKEHNISIPRMSLISPRYCPFLILKYF
jgi:hypothetical protein